MLDGWCCFSVVSGRCNTASRAKRLYQKKPHINAMEERIAGETLTLSASLSDPQDICLLPNNRLAVADQDLGVFVFDKNGHLRGKFIELSGSASLCYNSIIDQLAVVRYNADVDAEGKKYELCTINADIELETERYNLPNSPEVKEGYVRWIESVPETGNYLITSGDSAIAVIWMFDVKSHKWTTIYERKDCDLQHTQIRRGTHKWFLFVNKWEEKTGWNVVQLTFDDSFKVINEEVIIKPDGGNVVEPWTICVIGDDLMAVYDYKLGGISLYSRRGGKWIQSDIVGVVLAGQWVSLAIDETFVYASCSDEKGIRRFRRSL